MAFILLPLFFVTWLAFFQQEIPSFPPEGYTFRWFSEVTRNKAFASGFGLSLQVGLLATAIGLLLGVPASLAVVRSNFIGQQWINTLLLAPLVVPGVVLGTSLYVFQIEAEVATK